MDETILGRLPRFSWAEFKKHLAEQKPFEALSPMGTALFRVKRYEPCLGLAIHAGHQVREELLSKMSITEEERLYEEDYATEQFISDFPIQMIGLDSRYEYDVNRTRDQSVYLKPFQSWGKKVWVTPPTKEELDISYQKYDEFHEMLDCMVEQLLAHFKKLFILDVHSYNFKRQNLAGREATLPLFNLATAEADHKNHGKVLQSLMADLKGVTLPGFTTIVKENDVFKKDGAVSKFLGEKYSNCLSIPVEVKKVYMDEKSGELNREVTLKLSKALSFVAQKTTKEFFLAK